MAQIIRLRATPIAPALNATYLNVSYSGGAFEGQDITSSYFFLTNIASDIILDLAVEASTVVAIPSPLRDAADGSYYLAVGSVVTNPGWIIPTWTTGSSNTSHLSISTSSVAVRGF